MSDAFTDISNEEKEKIAYLAARITISKYVADRALKRQFGFVRDTYLKRAYSEVERGIKQDVEEIIASNEKK